MSLPPGGSRQAAPLLASAKRRLAVAAFDAPPREALLLLAHVLGSNEATLLARPELELSPLDAARFEALLERRLQGEPIAYLVGEKEFYGRSFLVDRRVLVPRPETEHLVEGAIALAGSGRGASRILDLGTGSGVVAITLALELRGARVTATDASIAALAVARVNRDRLSAPVCLTASSMLDAMEVAAFDLVVANLPYVDRATVGEREMQVLRWEPPAALFAGAQGLDRFRELLTAAPRLRSGALVLLEIGSMQTDAVTSLAAQYHLGRRGIVRDYSGHDRVLILERRPRE